MALEDDIEKWLRTQTYSPDQEITPFQRLKSRYLPPAGVNTWGEWYDLYNIKPVVKSEKETKGTKKPEETLDANQAFKRARDEYEFYKYQNKDKKTSLKNTIATLKEQQRAAEKENDFEKFNTVQKELSKYQSQLNEIESKERELFDNLNQTKEEYTRAKELKDTEKELKETEDKIKFQQETQGQAEPWVQQKKEDLERKKQQLTPPSAGVTPTPTPTPTPTTKEKTTDAVKQAKKQYEAEKKAGKGYTNRYGADGSSLVPGTEAYFRGSTSMPTVLKAPGAPQKTGGGAGGGAGAGAGAGGLGKDNKTLWVSYLRTTFASLDDKQQLGQINRLFNQAVDQGWDEKIFLEALKGTKWWQETLPSLRQFFLESNDPRNAATFAEKVKNSVDSIYASLEKLGIAVNDIDPTTGNIIDNSEFVEGIALEGIKNNWDDDQLSEYLATKANIIFTGGGTLGGYLDSIKRTAYNYGVKLDPNMERTINLSLLDSMDGRDATYWTNSVKQMALDAPQNKPFQEALKSGRSLYEVTSNYRQQMASLLEVDDTAITWNDLMSKVIDNETGNARTFADFTKALKKDPMWQYTKNAKETYSNMALDIARMFGFAG